MHILPFYVSDTCQSPELMVIIPKNSKWWCCPIFSLGEESVLVTQKICCGNMIYLLMSWLAFSFSSWCRLFLLPPSPRWTCFQRGVFAWFSFGFCQGSLRNSLGSQYQSPLSFYYRRLMNFKSKICFKHGLLHLGRMTYICILQCFPFP